MFTSRSRRNAGDSAKLLAMVGAFGLFAFSCRPVNSAPICNNCRPLTVAKISSFAYQPQILYQVAPALQQAAEQRHAMETSPDWDEFNAFRAFKAGYKAAEADAAKLAAEPAAQLQPAADPRPVPDAADPAQWAAEIPTIVAKCAKCHSGDDPAGKLWLDGTVNLRDGEHGAQQVAIMKAIVNYRMPLAKKGGHELTPLSADEYGAIVAELFQD